ncbi:MAG TPA: ABC transporter permease [Streptosporangiaceae bacterium]|jgi:ABC-2 type transport system permease protein
MTASQTITTAAPDTAAVGTARLPGALRVGVAQGRLELASFFRDRQVVFFVFALPAVLLVLLGSIYGNKSALHGLSVGQVFTAGMIAGGIAATSFQNLGLSIAGERDREVLKRLRGTPMPPAAYFVGKVVQVFVVAVAEVVVLVVVGLAFYHLHLPTSAAKWWTLAWVFVLGTVACSLLGIAASSLPKSAGSAIPVITLPLLVLQFISGVYVPFNNVPPWLQQIAALFPLKWMSQGLRSVFLPPQAVTLEPSQSWQHAETALVLGAWAVGGLVLCLTTFRWLSSSER